MDMRGQVVWEKDLGKLAAGTHRQSLATGHLADGLYVLLVEAGGDVDQARIVKGR